MNQVITNMVEGKNDINKLMAGIKGQRSIRRGEGQNIHQGVGEVEEVHRVCLHVVYTVSLHFYISQHYILT